MQGIPISGSLETLAAAAGQGCDVKVLRVSTETAIETAVETAIETAAFSTENSTKTATISTKVRSKHPSVAHRLLAQY